MAVDADRISVGTGINTMDEDESKDGSVKKPISAKKVPHYLRASTGSCHDSCKHAKPHVFKVKPWRAVKRMSAPQPGSVETVEVQIFVDRKVKKTVDVDNLEPPRSDEAPAANGKLRRSYRSPRKSSVHDLSKSVKQEARPFMRSPSPAPKVIKKTVQSPVRSSVPDISKLSKQEGASAPKKDVLSKTTPLNLKVRSVSAGPSRPSRSAVRPSLSPDVFTGLRNKPDAETKFSDLPRSARISARTVLTPPATTLSVKRSPKLNVKKPLDSSATLSSLHSSGVRAVRSSNVRKTTGIGQKDQAKRSQASAKNQILINKAELKHPTNEIVEEKTLHMIETKDDRLPTAPVANHFIQSPSPLSPESLNSSSQGNSLSFTSHEVDDQCELGMESTDSEADSKAADCLKQDRRNARNAGDDRDPKSLKLKFRRGKVVELKSEANSPRRLRFKQGAILGNDLANSGSKRKSFRKRADAGDKKEVDTNPVKVALKHQEAVSKDEQVLYNNVIKETASKLVEKRKSKVKALVGAFETVISLQERKPSAANR